jgi:hypothetical protein
LPPLSKKRLFRGKVIATRGNTVNVTAPGEGTPSGVVLDYAGNRAAFIGNPVVTKRTNRQLQSGFGAIAVQYYNMNNKQVEGAVVNTPAPVTQHPTGVIQRLNGARLCCHKRLMGKEFTLGLTPRKMGVEFLLARKSWKVYSDCPHYC